MKPVNIFFVCISFLSYVLTTQADSTIAGNSVSYSKLKNGDIVIGDIPKMIMGAIDFFMGLAGTIAIIFIIIGGYFIMFGDISSDKSKGKDIVFKAIAWFAISALSWVIIRFIIDNFN